MKRGRSNLLLAEIWPDGRNAFSASTNTDPMHGVRLMLPLGRLSRRVNDRARRTDTQHRLERIVFLVLGIGSPLPPRLRQKATPTRSPWQTSLKLQDGDAVGQRDGSANARNMIQLLEHRISDKLQSLRLRSLVANLRNPCFHRTNQSKFRFLDLNA